MRSNFFCQLNSLFTCSFRLGSHSNSFFLALTSRILSLQVRFLVFVSFVRTLVLLWHKPIATPVLEPSFICCFRSCPDVGQPAFPLPGRGGGTWPSAPLLLRERGSLRLCLQVQLSSFGLSFSLGLLDSGTQFRLQRNARVGA